MTFNAEVHCEDGSYRAQVREEPGAFATGDTLEELFEALRESIRACVNDEDAGTNLHIASAVLSSEPAPA